MTVNSGLVSHRVAHRGSICTSGTTCTGDRSLLDMIDLHFDQDGRVGVVFTDNNNRLAAPTLIDASKAGPFTHFAKQTDGPSLRADKPAVHVVIPEGSRTSSAGDATWPNTSDGTNLRALDLLGASLSLSGDGGRVVAQIPLSDATLAGIARDLNTYNASTTEPGARVQYVVRFSTGNDIFHMDMDYTPGTAAMRFFGGRLDANDGVQNGTGTVVAARYVADPGYVVSGSLRGGMLQLSAPKSNFAVDAGTRVVSVSAFALAGPTEADATGSLAVNSLRTIDATPPFDTTLQARTAPPAPVDCTDPAIEEQGGWHTMHLAGAGSGTLCRSVNGHQSNPRAYMQLKFTGSGADVIVARGPRGGSFNLTVDGGAPRLVDLYQAGTSGLTYGGVVHVDVPSGAHTLRIDVVNGSGDKTRNMVWVDGFAIYDGDATSVPATTTNSSDQVSGVLNGLVGAEYTLASTAMTVNIDTILQATPGTTITVKDPSGAVIASGTVEDGVLALQFGPHGIGVYTIDVGDPSNGRVPFELWEVVESR
jgi:hypothetical protein